jgi:hypothetical protein
MGDPRDNDDSPYDQRFNNGFDGRYDQRFDRRFDRHFGYNRPFIGYGRPYLYDYNRPYFDGPRYRYRGDNFGGGAIAAGIFGLALGAILNGAVNDRGPGYGSSHVRRCDARFRSYDRGSDSYMGYDGYRHRCNL